jgi:hypothetical protein
VSTVRRWIERLLFAPDDGDRSQRLLGFLVLGVVALGAWLIFWPLIPVILARLAVGLIDLFAALGSALSPASPTPAPPPPPPSPSPSPSPALPR